MTDQRLETEIREVFDERYVPNPDLDNKVIAALPWHAHTAAPAKRAPTAPRLAGAAVVVVAAILIGVLVVPTLIGRLQSSLPGFGGGEPPAYSLGAVDGGSIFIVQRGNVPDLGATPSAPANTLLQSTDNGRTWIKRLAFGGIYEGMQMFADAGVIWSIDMQFQPCNQNCTPPPMPLVAFRTSDGGAHWTALQQTQFPVQDAYFLDGQHGWVDSSSVGRNSDVLYQTADGGTTWSRVGPLPQDSPMGWVYGVANYHVTFSRGADGSLRGWYVGNTHLWTSGDGGDSWHPVTFPAPPSVVGWIVSAQQPKFVGDNGVVAVAYRDPKGPDNATANSIYLFVTSDGGATWGDPRSAPNGFAPVGDDLSIAILDPDHVWLTSLSESGGDNVQAAPAVARSSNGGSSWQVTRSTPRILQMMFADPMRGYALVVSGPSNVNGIFTTADGGTTWSQVNVPVFAAAKTH